MPIWCFLFHIHNLSQGWSRSRNRSRKTVRSIQSTADAPRRPQTVCIGSSEHQQPPLLSGIQPSQLDKSRSYAAFRSRTLCHMEPMIPHHPVITHPELRLNCPQLTNTLGRKDWITWHWDWAAEYTSIHDNSNGDSNGDHCFSRITNHESRNFQLSTPSIAHLHNFLPVYVGAYPMAVQKNIVL